MEKDVLAYIRKSHEQAEIDARTMKAALIAHDRAAFGSCLREYWLTRFELTESHAQGEERIEELARKSLILQKGAKAVRESDRAINCQNSSTAEDKTLLFILVTQRCLGVKLSPAQSAFIETLPELEEALWQAYAATA